MGDSPCGHPPSTEQGGVEVEGPREDIQSRDQHASIIRDKCTRGQSSWGEAFLGEAGLGMGPRGWVGLPYPWEDKEGGPFCLDSRVKGRWPEHRGTIGDALALGCGVAMVSLGKALIIFFPSSAPRSQNLSLPSWESRTWMRTLKEGWGQTDKSGCLVLPQRGLRDGKAGGTV